MILTPLFSGSSGNCLLVTAGGAKVLVDAGGSALGIARALQSLGTGVRDIDAVLITHEHSDHISAAGVLARRYGLKIHSNALTLAAMYPYLGGVSDGSLEVFGDSAFQIRDLTVRPFASSHDAASPVGFVFEHGGVKAASLTDAGAFTEGMEDAMRGASAVFIEANHDERMLASGPYPAFLKARIRGPLGHLSNSQASAACVRLVEAGARIITLAHLSEENNTPLAAGSQVTAGLEREGLRAGTDFTLQVAARHSPTQPMKV